MGSARRRRNITAGLLGLVQLGHAYWFFGNLYEATARIPDRLAARSTERVLSPFGPGSPARYYVPAAPATFPAAVAAAVSGWSWRRSRGWLIATAACSISGGAATAYLVRTVNMKLFFRAQPLTATERETLLHTWYCVNAFRLVAGGGAWLAAQKARSRLQDQHGAAARDATAATSGNAPIG